MTVQELSRLLQAEATKSRKLSDDYDARSRTFIGSPFERDELLSLRGYHYGQATAFSTAAMCVLEIDATTEGVDFSNA
jgi:hypothetical protein